MPEDSKLEAEHQIILDLCKQSEGTPEAAVLSHFPEKKKGVEVLNALLFAHRLVLLTGKDGSRFYKAVEEEEASRRKGLTSEEALVHQEIGKSQNSGIWTKDLRKRTGLSQPIVARAIKTLESRQLVKAVKSVNYANRKYYMLFDMEPSQQVTGGAWYTEQEFDKDFIDVLYDQSFKAIRQLGSASVEDVADAVNKSGVVNEPLAPKDFGALVQTLVYDGRVELDPDGQDDELFRVARLPPPDASAFAAMPCGVCPVIDECTPEGHISPRTCVYFNQWLEF